jgi:undecaprenyl diphosphate synthase
MSLKTSIRSQNLPKHIAIIMDGNGRWAKEKGLRRVFGHENGTKSVKTTVETCAELGIENLTLYAFSTENWKRPKLEVKTLMQLLISSLKKEMNTMQKNSIRLNAIGNLKHLPEKVRKELLHVMARDFIGSPHDHAFKG